MAESVVEDEIEGGLPLAAVALRASDHDAAAAALDTDSGSTNSTGCCASMAAQLAL